MDGVSPDVLYGFDYFAEYEDAGHQLFRDADRFQGRFIAGDLFDESPDSALEKTAGSWMLLMSSCCCTCTIGRLRYALVNGF